MTTAREALRAAAFKTRVPTSIDVEFEGVKYEIRAPTVKARGKIFERAGMTETDPKAKAKRDAAALQLFAVITCTFVPGTDERVFDDGDYEQLANEPAGGIADVLGTEAVKLLNASMDREAAKNG